MFASKLLLVSNGEGMYIFQPNTSAKVSIRTGKQPPSPQTINKLCYLKRFVWRNTYGDGNHTVQIVAPSGEVLLNSSQSRGTIEFNDYGWIPKGSVIKHWGNHVDWTYFDGWLAYEPEAVSISLDDVTRIL